MYTLALIIVAIAVIRLFIRVFGCNVSNLRRWFIYEHIEHFKRAVALRTKYKDDAEFFKRLNCDNFDDIAKSNVPINVDFIKQSKNGPELSTKYLKQRHLPKLHNKIGFSLPIHTEYFPYKNNITRVFQLTSPDISYHDLGNGLFVRNNQLQLQKKSKMKKIKKSKSKNKNSNDQDYSDVVIVTSSYVVDSPKYCLINRPNAGCLNRLCVKNARYTIDLRLLSQNSNLRQFLITGLKELKYKKKLTESVEDLIKKYWVFPLKLLKRYSDRGIAVLTIDYVIDDKHKMIFRDLLRLFDNSDLIPNSNKLGYELGLVDKNFGQSNYNSVMVGYYYGHCLATNTSQTLDSAKQEIKETQEKQEKQAKQQQTLSVTLQVGKNQHTVSENETNLLSVHFTVLKYLF